MSLAALGVVLAAASTAGAAGPPAPDWAYSGAGPATSTSPAEQNRVVTVPGAPGRFKASRTGDLFFAVDWRPATHPPMPPIVAHGRAPDAMACGYCHLPAGEGRPENAALAGLPADYIVRQVHHFATGARLSGRPGWIPNVLMTRVSHGVSPTELDAAARYFSAQRFTSRVRVVEAGSVPQPHAAHFLFVSQAGRPAEALGQRIVEGPSSMERFELRDSWIDYTAYVPIGAPKRGAALAAGAGGVQACEGCHGAGLKGGGIAPPLAGRSPSYLFRQLYAFKSGIRGGPDAAPMKAVTAPLAQADMIALAAYAGSLKP